VTGREVAIVGAATSTRHLVNDLPPHVERWGQNNLYVAGFLREADVWFEMHPRTLYDTQIAARRPSNYIGWLAEFQGPVYMWQLQPGIPNSTRYPFVKVVEDVGDYLTSTIAYMLALAIHERAKVIHIYGVDMASRGDYADQRPCCEYLIGLARGRGIEVRIPEQSLLLKGPVYGTGDRITDAQFTNRLADLQRSYAETQHHLQRLEGAIREAQFWANATPEGVTQEAFAAQLTPTLT
jgi:hypothetical protein